MSERSMFDHSWERQDQWGGEWHSLNGRFIVAGDLLQRDLAQSAAPPAADWALDEVVAWILNRLEDLVKTKVPDKTAEFTQFAQEVRRHVRPLPTAILQQLERWMDLTAIEPLYPDRLRHTQKLVDHLRTTNFDHAQLQHLRGLFDAQHHLAIAYHALLGNGGLTRWLEIDPDAPLIHVNADLMAKCTTDLRLAQQAVHQRQRLQQNNQSTTKITWEGHMLFLADLMAYECVTPLKDAGLLPTNTAVVTYFQQATEIRLIPYYNILLIGLPSWVQNLYHWPPPAFLVIPHEVGHSLFRFGVVNRPGQPRVHAVLEQALAQQQIAPTDWRARWLEELFADAFGCLRAGPASILGLQEYLATGVPAHFIEPTPHHPTAALRPLIQTEMLRIMDARNIRSYKHAPDLLDSHWQQFLTNNGGALRTQNIRTVDFSLPGQNATLSGQEVLTQVRPILELIFNLFDELFPGDHAPTHWQSWSEDVAPGGGDILQKLGELQKQYQQFYHKESVYTVQPPAVGAYQPSSLHTQIEEITDTLTRQPADLSLGKWQQIYNIAGWTDEGGGDMGNN